MTFVQAINIFADMFSWYGNYYFHSLTTDKLAVGYPNILEALWIKFMSAGFGS
jgi:hypothetical protein